MKLFGLEITKSASAARPIVQRSGGFFAGSIKEAFSGAWQRNIEYTTESVLNNPTLFRCINLIASDIGKMDVLLTIADGDDVWTRTENPAFSPVLRKPNGFQTRQQFLELWMLSKLTHGNTYVLKRRDARNVVVGLYVLDPRRVTPLITPTGEVWYRLQHDDLSGVAEEGIDVPATEIIHDRYNTLYHPLVGLSPIMAAGLAAHSGNEIASNSARFFANGARPGGILTAPGSISDETANELKTYWDTNFSGTKSGKIAVVGDGLTYTPLTSNAVDSQLIEQLRWSDEKICSTLGVPSYLVGIGQAPAYNNISALTTQYYNTCLQSHATAIENTLDLGLALPSPYHVLFNIDDLIRMDEESQVRTLKEGVSGGLIAPNEARRKLNLKPVKGGSAPYLQQQNFSLEALAERDSDKPFAKPEPAPAPTNEQTDEEAELEATKALAIITKGLSHGV